MAVPSPDLPALLGLILPALPSATVSTEPAIGILPLLSPILRQRVQLFSASSTEPWLRLLCYDPNRTARLTQAVRSAPLEPHPVSGEVEVDWDRESTVRFRRLDKETFQALALLNNLDLAFQMLYCTGKEGEGEIGWRVSEVTLADGAVLSGFHGFAAIDEAEEQFRKRAPAVKIHGFTTTAPKNNDDDDDDGYWDRYDATPARTPAPQPTFQTTNTNPNTTAPIQDEQADDDDDYYAQYDSVQPAMDNRDPDEEAQLSHIQPPLGLARVLPSDFSPTAWTSAEAEVEAGAEAEADLEQASPVLDPHAAQESSAPGIGILQPRPESSASSGGAGAVAQLEAEAGKQAQSEFGVKQHIGRSVRSLWALAVASGIEREEFERIVRTELELLGMEG